MKPHDRIAVIPKLGDYNKPLNRLIKQTLDCKVIDCPPITKHTVEIGAKHSPDTVCTPFKILTGNFIESLEAGANTLIMPGFGCRLGFYDMLHKQILEHLGYQFEMVALCDYMATPTKIFNTLSSINTQLTREKFDEIFADVCLEVANMDKTANLARRKVDTNQPSLKICILGDLYTVIEPHANCNMEDWLKRHNVEIFRYTDLTYLALNLFDIPKLINQSGGYIDYNLGGNANCSIAQAYQMLKHDKVDGIIHVKAATCAPEISAMSVLQTMSNDFQTPIMYLTFDTETSDAGLHTRLEAFLDMLSMATPNR